MIDGLPNITPYYQQDDIVIYHGDCRDILPCLPKVDLVLIWCIDLAFSISESICIMPGLWAIPLCMWAMGSRYKWIIAGHNKNGMTHGAIGFGNWIPAVCAGNIKHGGQDAIDFIIGREIQYEHPDQKPYPFITFLVNRLSENENLILDPFMGSGTTLVAAKQLHRKCIGIEIEEAYVKIAVKRLGQGVLEI